MIIAVDFDGTCVRHEYPAIGQDAPNAVDVLTALTDAEHQLILSTMRSGKTLQDAVAWFNDRNIPLYGVNANPTQRSWTNSPKVYAQMYIGDDALGCPLVVPWNGEGRPYVDWDAVASLLQAKGLI